MNSSLEEVQTESLGEILIDSEGPGLRPGIAELWRYRELVYFLTLRDIKLRYKQTLLGAAWAIIQPLLAMLLFTLVFGRLARMPSDNIPYPVFAYAGLVPWTFFANAITNAGNSLVGSTSLITKVYFPRVIIPAAPVLAGLVDLVVALLLLAPLLFYYRITITWNILFLPVFICMAALLAFGVGMLLAALNVKYRDVRYALPFLVQLWLFASPVIYPVSLIPAKLKWIFTLNPMVGIINGVRSSLFAQPFDWTAIGASLLVTLVVAGFAAYFFQRVEDDFADVI